MIRPSRSRQALTGYTGLSVSALLIATLTGCASMTGNNTVEAEILHAGANCGGGQTQAAIHVIDNHRRFAAAMERTQGHSLGSVQEISPPDFQQTVALWVEMGQKPSGGFALGLREQETRVENNTLRLALNWIEPDPGSLVTQALTSPCLLVAVPRGDYARVEAVDQEGQIRASTGYP